MYRLFICMSADSYHWWFRSLLLSPLLYVWHLSRAIYSLCLLMLYQKLQCHVYLLVFNVAEGGYPAPALRHFTSTNSLPFCHAPSNGDMSIGVAELVIGLWDHCGRNSSIFANTLSCSHQSTERESWLYVNRLVYTDRCLCHNKIHRRRRRFVVDNRHGKNDGAV